MNKRVKALDALSNLIEQRFEKARATFQVKAEEYATIDNRLHNFDVAARILDVTPEQALQGMMMKHIVSVLDLIEWTSSKPEKLTNQVIDEKLGDTINYLILLESLLLRRIEKGGLEEVEE